MVNCPGGGNGANDTTTRNTDGKLDDGMMGVE
jgi:hypothetical protein